MALIKRFAVVAVWLATANFVTAAPPVGDQLDPVIKRAADVARARKFQSLLVIARADSQTNVPDAENILKVLRDEIQDALAVEKLQGKVSPEAEKSLGDGTTAKALGPAVVPQLKQAARFDAVLSVEYRQRPGDKSRTLTLQLFNDDKKVHWTTKVVLKDDAAIARRKTPTVVTKRVAVVRQSGSSSGATFRINEGNSAQSAGGAAAAAAVAGSGSSTNSTTPATKKPEPSEAAKQAGLSAPELNQKVVGFAAGQIGKRVGNGECWTLAAEALKAAGAQPPDGDKFGDPVSLDKIAPGDILQFTSATFVEGNKTMFFGQPNHTAIVYTASGSRTFILHQHFDETKTVGTMDFDLSTKTAGDVVAYRPVLAKK